MAWRSENKTCSGILDFLHWLNNRIRGTLKKGIAIIWSRQYTRGNQLSCGIFCEVAADGADVF